MLTTQFLDAISSVSATLWDDLWSTDYPFTQHRFLAALEDSHCVTTDSGWQPHHCLVYDDGALVAAMILYVKYHSYGEYVFDWSWADAYQNNGLPYYPKLVNAIPFTPATGPRWATSAKAADATAQHYSHHMFDAVRLESDKLSASGFHCLFSDKRPLDASSQFKPLMLRSGCQYHWFNQDFTDFDGFLSTFSARKRKNVNRERRKVTEQGVTTQVVVGTDLTSEDWHEFYQLYSRTYLKRSGHTGYLNADFFHQIGATMAAQTMMVKGIADHRWVSAALYFYDCDTLYGRYWGATTEFDALHFECCFYRGIEFAIEQGLQRFDPGAQGEHKIARGFTPVFTRSWHWLSHPQFAAAIAHFLQEEQAHIERYCADARQHLPFKEGFIQQPANRLFL